jgi:hypothetical protein
MRIDSSEVARRPDPRRRAGSTRRRGGSSDAQDEWRRAGEGCRRGDERRRRAKLRKRALENRCTGKKRRGCGDRGRCLRVENGEPRQVPVGTSSRARPSGRLVASRVVRRDRRPRALRGAEELARGGERGARRDRSGEDGGEQSRARHRARQREPLARNSSPGPDVTIWLCSFFESRVIFVGAKRLRRGRVRERLHAEDVILPRKTGWQTVAANNSNFALAA